MRCAAKVRGRERERAWSCVVARVGAGGASKQCGTEASNEAGSDADRQQGSWTEANRPERDRRAASAPEGTSPGDSRAPCAQLSESGRGGQPWAQPAAMGALLEHHCLADHPLSRGKLVCTALQSPRDEPHAREPRFIVRVRIRVGTLEAPRFHLGPTVLLGQVRGAAARARRSATRAPDLSLTPCAGQRLVQCQRHWLRGRSFSEVAHWRARTWTDCGPRTSRGSLNLTWCTGLVSATHEPSRGPDARAPAESANKQQRPRAIRAQTTAGRGSL